MKRRDFIKVVLFIGLVFVIGYLLNNKNSFIVEHLTEAPPSLTSLHEETKDLKKEISKVSLELKEMKTKSEAGARQAEGAMAQISAAKTQ
jgi:predicted  nucleic acid-binding Zn-ribbon protein